MEFVIVLIFCTLFANSVTENYETVSTNYGNIRGLKSTSRSGRSYTGYKGIQYGVVTKRFQKAIEPQPWKGVKNALEFGRDCAQNHLWSSLKSTDENCQFLNLYVPEDGSNEKAVIFYIHGGAWIQGSGRELGEKFFMDEDVILVTMNYRLGAFGFLALKNIPEASGNIGFHDQLLALKWVRDNIHHFHGDPNRVTIMGESAGAGSVANFVVSPLAKGLFQQAIHHSGATFNGWTWRPLEKIARTHEAWLGETLGCDTSTNQNLFNCLLKTSAEDILKAQEKMVIFYDPLMKFPPVVNKEDPNAFLPQSPNEALRQGKFNRVPTIFTVCEEEGLLLHAAWLIKSESHITALNEDWIKTGDFIAFLDDDSRLPKLSDAQKVEILTQVREHYFGQNNLKVNDPWTMDRLEEFYTDRYFLHGIRETALTMSQFTPVYTGLFTNVGAASLTQMFGYNETLGITHVDDLQFFFNDFGLGPWPLTEKLTEYSQNLVKIWVNFAQTGVPSGIVNGVKFEWPQVSEEERRTKALNWVNLGKIPSLVRNPFADRLKIWDKIYEKYEIKDELPGHIEL